MAGALAAVYLVLSWSFRIGAYAGERAGARAAHLLRLALVERVLDPRGGAESGRLPGALTAIATEDARRVGAVNLALMAGIAALVGIASGAAVLLSISLPLGLVVVLGTPLLMLLGHLLSRPLERRSRAEQERAAHASAVAADLVAGLRVLKGPGPSPPRSTGTGARAPTRSARPCAPRGRRPGRTGRSSRSPGCSSRSSRSSAGGSRRRGGEPGSSCRPSAWR